jgi:hypothetical protein
MEMELACETICERVDELISTRKGPLLATDGTRAVVEELVARSEGLERAIREIAFELQELTTAQAKLDALTGND